MKPDLSSLQPEELEVKITALILGELDPAEASALRQVLARDERLARLHADLARTLDLVREAVAQPADPTPGTVLPRMDVGRRETLLARLRIPGPASNGEGAGGGNGTSGGTVIPVEFPVPVVENRGTQGDRRRNGGSVWLALAACLVALLGLASVWTGSNRLRARPEAVAWHSPPPGAAGGAAPPRDKSVQDLDLVAGGRFRELARGRGAEVDHKFGRPVQDAPAPESAAVSVSEPAAGAARGSVSESRRAADAGRPGLAGQPQHFGLSAYSKPNSPAPASKPPDNDWMAGKDAAGVTSFYAMPIEPAVAAVAEAKTLSTVAVPAARFVGRAQGGTREKALTGRGVALADRVDFSQQTLEAESLPQLKVSRAAAAPARREERSTPSALARGVVRENLAVVDDAAASRVPILGQEPQLGLLFRKQVAAGESLNAPAAPVPQPEVQTEENPFSTFSLNVTDVSFKLAGAALDAGSMPDPGSIRTEEFLNAFHYRDPEPAAGRPVAFAWDRAKDPFSQQRDLLRLAVRTAALGREAGRPLNLVLAVDNSGSMERSDRVRTLREAMRALAVQMKPEDRVSLVSFARTARLWLDGLPGDRAGELADSVGVLAPEGGTNLEDALRVGYETALKHFTPMGVNRLVLLTDGAANLGDVHPESLQRTVESYRRRGVALDAFGIGWEGFNDTLLETLSRNGDGRYGFVNTPEAAAAEFAAQLAGALQVAANDVKVQVEFNPRRVTSWRQIGYAKHQLTAEQFRDNTVDAAEIGAAESGNALYAIGTNPRGQGPIATVRVRFKVPATGLHEEHEWAIPYSGPAPELDQAAPAMKLATTAAAFSEWLASNPHAGEVSPEGLLRALTGVPAAFQPDTRPARLESMIRQAQSLSGR